MKKVFCFAFAILFAFLMCSCGMNGEKETPLKVTDNAAATTQERYQTYTGNKPLSSIDLVANEPSNKSLSVEKIEHAYGVAKDSKPHSISVDSQKYFESKGYKAVTFDNLNENKVLYLTFDCGYENGYTEKILDTLKAKDVKATFFCTLDDIKSEPELIARMIKEGHIVGNHSSSHPSFAEISRQEMADEIEECENYLRQNFGYTSKYFRFPKGEYSESALELVSSLGFVSVFWSLSYADWDTSKQKGAEYAFEKLTSRLHPGAIILLHSVSSDNAGAMAKFIDYAREQGYSFESLDNLKLSYVK